MQRLTDRKEMELNELTPAYLLEYLTGSNEHVRRPEGLLGAVEKQVKKSVRMGPTGALPPMSRNEYVTGTGVAEPDPDGKQLAALGELLQPYLFTPFALPAYDMPEQYIETCFDAVALAAEQRLTQENAEVRYLSEYMTLSAALLDWLSLGCRHRWYWQGMDKRCFYCGLTLWAAAPFEALCLGHGRPVESGRYCEDGGCRMAASRAGRVLGNASKPHKKRNGKQGRRPTKSMAVAQRKGGVKYEVVGLTKAEWEEKNRPSAPIGYFSRPRKDGLGRPKGGMKDGVIKKGLMNKQSPHLRVTEKQHTAAKSTFDETLSGRFGLTKAETQKHDNDTLHRERREARKQAAKAAKSDPAAQKWLDEQGKAAGL